MGLAARVGQFIEDMERDERAELQEIAMQAGVLARQMLFLQSTINMILLDDPNAAGADVKLSTAIHDFAQKGSDISIACKNIDIRRVAISRARYILARNRVASE